MKKQAGYWEYKPCLHNEKKTLQKSGEMYRDFLKGFVSVYFTGCQQMELLLYLACSRARVTVVMSHTSAGP